MFILSLMWIALFGLQIQVEYDTEAMAKEARQRAMQAAEKEIERTETAIKNAATAKDAEQLKTLRQELKAAKEALAEAKSKKHADYVAEAEEKIRKWRASTANYAEQTRKEEKRKQQEAKELAEAKAKAGPVFIDFAAVQRNQIGLPELHLWVSNTTGNEIEAFEVEAECFNSFDEPVKDLTGSNVFKGVCTTTLNPREESSVSWQLSLHGGTTRAIVWVKRVKLADGEVWSQTRAEAEKKKRGLASAKKAKQ